MKTVQLNNQSKTAPHPRGTAMVMVLMFVVALASLALSMSMITVANTASTDNACDRQQALMLAQAGFSAAVNKLNSTDTTVATFNTQTLTANWGAAQRYDTVTSRNADGTYTILSTGSVSNAASVGNSATVQRQLKAIVLPGSTAGQYPAGLFGKDKVQFNGAAVIDSYSYSISYTYLQQVLTAGGKALFQAILGNKGNIGSNGPINGDGAVIIYGSATPGPTSNVNLKGLLGTGLLSFVTGSTAPAATPLQLDSYVYSPPIPATGAYSLSGLGFATMNAGTYHYTSFNQAGQTLTITGAVSLYVDGDISQSGLGLIIMSPNASLTVYQGSGGKYNLAGLGLLNLDLNPSTYSIVSASTSTVTVNAVGDTFVNVYAPDADVTLRGVGELYGAAIGKSITVDGVGLLHWDRLAKSPAIKVNMRIIAQWEVDI